MLCGLLPSLISIYTSKLHSTLATVSTKMAKEIDPELFALLKEHQLEHRMNTFDTLGISNYHNMAYQKNRELKENHLFTDTELLHIDQVRNVCIKKINEQKQQQQQQQQQIQQPTETKHLARPVLTEVGNPRLEHHSSLVANTPPQRIDPKPTTGAVTMPEIGVGAHLNETFPIPTVDYPNYSQDELLTMGYQPQGLPSMAQQQQPRYMYQSAPDHHYSPHPAFQHRFPNPLECQPQTMVNVGQCVPTNYVHPHMVPQGQYPTPRQQLYSYQPDPNQQQASYQQQQQPIYSIPPGSIPPQQYPYRPPGPERDHIPNTPMTNPPLNTHYTVNYSKGLGLIFTNESFDRDPEWKRDGAKQDEENFKDIYQMMGLECRPFFDFTTEQIIQTLEGIVEEEGLAQYPMLCIGFSTHGGQGDVLYGKDGKKFYLYNQVVSLFKPDKCPNLSGRPKVFLVQACRGESRGGIRADSIEAHIPHTLESDFLIAHSAVSGHQAYRHVNTGSWFISQLKNAILTYRENYHFLDILTFVNQFIVNNSAQNKEYSQTCQFESTLTRILKIDPKHP